MRASPLLLTASLLMLPLIACSDDPAESAGKADVTIVSLTPEAAYPGVEIALDLTIAPQSGTSESGISWSADFGDGSTITGEGLAGTPAHSYQDSGTFTVTVNAIKGGKKIGEATRDVIIYPPVDLALKGVRGTPANVRTGGTLSVEATLANALPVPVETPFSVAAYLTKNASVTRADLPNLTKLGEGIVARQDGGLPVIVSGMDRVARFDVSVPADVAAGDWRLVLLADSAGQVADTNLDNNLLVSSTFIRIESVDATRPDVVVRDLLWAPERAYPTLNRVTRGYTLTNQGGADIFKVVVKTYLSVGDDILDDADTLINTSEPVDLIAQATKEILPAEFLLDDEIAPPIDGELDVWVIVKAEPTEGDEESDTNNNVLASDAAIKVSSEPVEGPDVVVKDFTVTPTQTFLDGTLSIKLDIANDGTQDVGSFVCGLFLGAQARINTGSDQRVTTLNVTQLPKQTARSIERVITVPALIMPGTYYMYAVCDPNGALGEPIRSNNSRIFPDQITITDEADVDLAIDALDAPTMANEGEEIMLTATICVTGSNPSGATRGQLFRTAGSRVDFTAPPVAEFDVPNINPDTCAQVAIPYTFQCDQFQERYALGIRVDSESRLPELDEGNNTRPANGTVLVAGTFCKCTEDAYEPNDRASQAAAITPGLISGGLCAAGTCDYYKVSLQAGDSLLTRNTFDPTRGVLVTTLFTPSGLTTLDVERSNTSPHEVEAFLVATAGDYLISVCGSQTATRNLYELGVDVLSQVADVDVLPRAFSLTQPRTSYSIGARVQASFEALNLGQIATPGFDAQFYLTPNNTLGDGDDIPIESIGITPLGAAARRTINADLRVPTTIAAGDYYIAVVLDPAGQLTEARTTNNTAFLGPITVVSQCFDPLEPNDNFTEAYEIQGSASFSNLLACAAASDYYKLCLTDGKRFTATAAFTEAMGDIDVELYNEQLQIIDSSIRSGVDSEDVGVDYVSGDQCYYVRVFMLNLNPMAENGYSLAVDVQDVPPALRCDSWEEPNDSFNNASSLISAVQRSATMTIDRCPAADTDFYAVDLAQGQPVTLRAIKQPGAQAGTLRLQIYRPNRAPDLNIETAPDVPSAELTNYIPPTSGRYYLQVTVGGTTRNVAYKLEATGLNGVDMEPSAINIGPGTYAAGDVLRVGFTLKNLGTSTATSSSYTISMGAQPTPDIANDALLGSFMGPALNAGASVSLFQQLTLPASIPTGQVYLHVTASAPGEANASNDTASVAVTTTP
jgi:PKD repeat protein